MKRITGTWFEFTHHNSAEGVYWNPACRAFTEAQWREKLREIAGLGMKYVVLMATSLVDEDRAEAYFPTDIYPFPEDFPCQDPVGVLLSEADALHLRVFLSVGYYGPWRWTMENMTNEDVTRRAFRAMEQLFPRAATACGNFRLLRRNHLLSVSWPDEPSGHGRFLRTPGFGHTLPRVSIQPEFE